MTDSAHDLLTSIDFAKALFATWQESDMISEQQLLRIQPIYDRWASEVNPATDYTAALPPAEICLESQEGAELERRMLLFVQQELRRHATHQRLTPGQVQSLTNDVASKLHELSNREPEPRETPATDIATAKGRTMVEMLLDPRSLQAMMGTGGALLVLGLVAWLWSIGMFKNPLVVASCLGFGNLALLATGAAMVRYSRYQTAGRATTLLACLVLPLNLWFYNAQGIVTINDGDHLWMPAVVCCVIYAGVARLLKDSLFVYTLVAGVTMTGLLLLADQQVGRFWEVIAPSTFLVVLGIICVHVERLFNEGDGPFSRQSFGRAFFNSGHTVMGSGLLVLLSGRLMGWFYAPLLDNFSWFTRAASLGIPDVATVATAKFCALLLVLFGTYTYIYSQLVSDRRGHVFAYSAMATLFWCEVILLDLLKIAVTVPVLLLVLASTGFAALLASTLMHRKATDADHLSKALARIGQTCTAISVLWGTGVLGLGLFVPECSLPGFNLAPLFGLAMLITAGACSLAALTERRRNNPLYSVFWMRILAVPVVATAATGLALLNVESLAMMLLLLVLLPLLVEVAICRTAPENWLRQLIYTTYTGTLMLLAMSIGESVAWLTPNASLASADRLMLAGFYAVAAGLAGAAAMRRREMLAVAAAGVSGCAAVWQLLGFAGLAEYAPIVAASMVGVAVMLGTRVLAVRDEQQVRRMAMVGCILVTIGAASGLLMTMGRLLASDAELPLLALAAGQAIAALAAAGLTPSADWKRTLRTLAGLHVLMGALVLNVLSELTVWQQGEMLVVASGLLLLAAGHLRWHKEGEKRDPLVDFNLLAGSMLAAGPLVLGLLAQRITSYSPMWGYAMMHEVGSLALGLGLLGAGVMCRVRVTTLVGSGMLVAWVLSLVTLLHLPELENAAIYMMIGGGLFFAVAVLLSVYRDRLLALPRQVKDREGVFRVLEWR